MPQKVASYGCQAANVGDVEPPGRRASALRDVRVRESDAGRQVWFLPDEATLEARLTPPI